MDYPAKIYKLIVFLTVFLYTLFMNSNVLFTPKLNILPAPQRKLWNELGDIPPAFTLYGGTAVALHLGHRHSIDFDFFGNEAFDPDDLYRTVPFLNNAKVVQKQSHTLTCLIDREGVVQVSFFGVPELKRISPQLYVNENDLKVASLIDLAGLKTAVIQKRAEAKDYIDLDAIFQQSTINLPIALSAGQYIYGSSFNPLISLKALCSYDDGNLYTLLPEIRERLTNAVKQVDLNNLPPINDLPFPLEFQSFNKDRIE